MTRSSPTPAGTDLALKRDWDLDASDLSQLELKKSCRMLYTIEEVPLGSRPAANDPFAWVNMNDTAFPTLQTVNSNYFEKVWCDLSAGWIKMKFDSWDPYDYAWHNWHNVSRPKWGDYVIITPEASCKNYDDTQQRYFVQATSEERDDHTMTITCRMKDVSLTDAVGQDNPVEVEFENFNQGNVSAQANKAEPDRELQDLSGEVLKDPSGDSDFDWYLDSKIGKIDAEALNNGTIAQFNITLEDFYGGSDLPDLAKENLTKRRIGDRIKKAVKKVATAVKTAVQKTGEALKKVGEVIVETAKKVGDALADFTTIDRDLDRDIDFDTSELGNIVRTPFSNREGYKLFSADFEGQSLPGDTEASGSLEVFCVECGVEGDFNIRGKVVFVLSRLQFQEGFVEVSGSLGAGLGLGIVANLELTKEFKKQITSIPLQPFAIPNVFVLGPKFDLSAGVEFNLEAEGQLLAGVKADWPAIRARIDVVNSDGSFANGFTPQLTPFFEVEGEITLTTTFFLEGALGVGIDVGNGLFDKSVELIERPGVFISAGVGASFSLENGTGGFGEDDCRGLEIAVGFSNEVAVNVFDIDRFSKTIDERSIDVDSRCFPFFKKREELPPLPLIEARQQETDGIGAITFEGGILSKITTRDEESSFRLRYSPNGNIYAVADNKVPEEDKAKEWSGWFATDPSGVFVFGDSHGRFLHGYHDTLLESGVSRLRLHKPDEMPKTTQLMVFASIIDDFTNSSFEEPSDLPYMVASDLGGNVYFPIICVYASETVYPKMFLANDTEVGAAMLMSNDPEILRTVTGAEVEECQYMPLTNGIRGMDIEIVQEDNE
ncbi:hypothetical protein BKA56DRAFT_681969 [Ilyonectria sp. MPI-CAGE-AT-0026]|nr:hypothetical protein BKA56DRAFT_681969 [Ilyonectria sp. MPI-CAGE-AT-0026]